MKVIGLGGLKESGKDTVADYLVERHGWVKIGMSDALADALLTLDPIINVEAGAVQFPVGFHRYSVVEKSLGYTMAKRIPEVRRLLQVLGTEIGRERFGENVWVDVVRRFVENLEGEEVPGVAVTGIRYPNELEMIRSLGGETVWVERPGLLAGAGAEHSSENTLAPVDFDVVLMNRKDVEALYGVVEAWLSA